MYMYVMYVADTSHKATKVIRWMFVIRETALTFFENERFLLLTRLLIFFFFVFFSLLKVVFRFAMFFVLPSPIGRKIQTVCIKM